MKITNSSLVLVTQITIAVWIFSIFVNSLLLFMVTILILSVLLLIDLFTGFFWKDSFGDRLLEDNEVKRKDKK
jgi:hypothetical protein